MSAISLYRIGHRLYRRNLKLPARVVQRMILMLHSSWIPVEAEIGPGTELAYGGIGVVIHPRVRIGAGVFVSHQVTIGGRSRIFEVPVIGDNCFLGPGAKILGPVTIGRESVVGANAVVIDDVPARCVAAGIPARIVRRGIRIHDYYTPGLIGDDAARRVDGDERRHDADERESGPVRAPTAAASHSTSVLRP